MEEVKVSIFTNFNFNKKTPFCKSSEFVNPSLNYDEWDESRILFSEKLHNFQLLFFKRNISFYFFITIFFIA